MFREELFGTDLVRLLDGKNLDERAPRQDTYTAVRSLYTAAAYEKSADIFRMIMLTLGKDAFYSAMTHFLKEHEGKAVTLENMLDSLSTSTGVDVRVFLPWFTEDGIPKVSITDEYNAELKKYTLKVSTLDGKGRPIPIVLGLLDSSGKEIVGDSLVMIDKAETQITFNEINSRPTPSLLRSFSAPVYFHYEYSADELLFLMKHDTNIYNRCEAAKNLILNMVSDYCSGKEMIFSPTFFDTYRSLLTDKSIPNQWLVAELLALPSEEDLISGLKNPHFEKIAEAHVLIQRELANKLAPDLYQLNRELQTQEKTKSPDFSIFDIEDAGRRRLTSVCYSYIQHLNRENTETYLTLQFRDSLKTNMTQTTDALRLLCNMNSSKVDELLGEFYSTWKDDANAINYWFKIQASAHFNDAVERVSKLVEHEAFDITNPNKVYSVLGSFIGNPYGFHQKDGKGYQLLTDVILKLDKINPAVAARLTEAFVNWEKYDSNRQHIMLDNLKKINENAVSVDVKNIAKKGLDKAKGSSPLPVKLMFLGASETQVKPSNESSITKSL